MNGVSARYTEGRPVQAVVGGALDAMLTELSID